MTRPCVVSGCQGSSRSRGMCPKHYARWRKHGTPQGTDRNHADPAEKLWRRVRKSEGCWEWTGALTGTGYAQVRTGGKDEPKAMAHRLAYELSVGPVPEGMVVMHLCDNRRCVRPDHLRLGTPRENTLDMIAKGRDTIMGARHWNARLTEDQVRWVRAQEGRSPTQIARELGVSLITVQHILKRRTWKHLEQT